MLIKLKHIHTLTWKVTQNSKREGSQGQNLKLSRKKIPRRWGCKPPKRKTLPWHGEYGYGMGDHTIQFTSCQHFSTKQAHS